MKSSRDDGRALAAHVGLVDFHRSGELLALVRALPPFADAVQHEPGGRLADADVAVKLHAGDALEACDLEIDGDGPLAQRHPRALQSVPVRSLKYERQSAHQ